MAEKSGEPHTSETLNYKELGLRLRSIFEKYGYMNDRVVVTQELSVPVHRGGDMEIRQIIIKESNMYNYVVCMLDEDGYTPIYSFADNLNSMDIFDGNGKEITDSEELKMAHDLIVEAELAAQFLVEQTVDSFSIQTHAVEGLKLAIENHKQELARLERLLLDTEGKEDASYTTFKITITDAWEKEGGASISQVFLASTLKQAIQAAVDEFKRTNNRSDVQYSHFSVSVYDGTEEVLVVPNEVMSPYIRAITKSDRVADARMYAK